MVAINREAVERFNKYNEKLSRYQPCDDPRNEFMEHLLDQGFQNIGQIIEGRIVRVMDSQDKGKKRTGWYVYHEFDDSYNDGNVIGCGAYGTWRDDVTHNWMSRGVENMSPVEKVEFQERRKEAEKIRREEEQQRQLDAALACFDIYQAAHDANPEHGYLTTKQINPLGAVKQKNDSLIIPMMDSENRITSLQYIKPDGTKKYHPGGKIKGSTFIIPGTTQKIYVVEGYATGASVHMATGASVYCAFMWSNLYEVTCTVQQQYPQAEVVIAGDDDAFIERNVGRNKANEICSTLQGVSARFPEFADISDKPTDWNDLHCMEGLEEVKRQIETVSSRPAYRTSYRASELQHIEFPPVKYVVEGYIVEGLTLLAGVPKIGKSWSCLDVALSVASGGAAYGSIDCEQGDVLYLALEDNPRRLQSRLRKMMRHNKQPWPAALQIETEWPILGVGCEDKISEWIEQAARPRLIIIDTMARIKPPQKQNTPLYDSDYKVVASLQALSQTYGVAIVIVTHTRKQDSDDPIEKVSGTLGLSGAADSILVLDRKAEGVTLYGRGRDIEEIETAMEFDKKRFIWRILGDASILQRTPERQQIIAVLEEAEAPMTPKDIAEALNEDGQNIRQLVSKMAEKGEIEKVSRGKYRAITPHHNDHSDHNESEITPESDLVTDVIGLQ
jgi:phage/plasmid primase-like uncharacterized protein